MKSLSNALGLALLFASPLLSPIAQAQTPVDGRWDAQLLRGEVAIPFRLDISSEAGNVKGTLYDGFRPYEHSTGASFQDGKLELELGHYLTTFEAELQDGRLVGKVVAQGRGAPSEYPLIATRHDEKAARTAAAVEAPVISGAWEIQLEEPNARGEQAHRFVVEQKDAEVAGAIYRVDGDSGAYSGVFKDGKWVLSHYDGSRPGVIEVTPQADGSLEIRQANLRPRPADGSAYSPYSARWIAWRPEVARAKGLPKPISHLALTTPRDPDEKFVFSFPDLDGRLHTQADAEFKGKPILAVVTGTWCPNCHDEAQYLVQLDEKYRDQGLRIVALTFEEEEQSSLQRARAFVKQYGVTYPYLYAGAPEEVKDKLPQLVNFSTFPATVFIGRDGTIRAIHAGFGSPSTGEFYQQQDKEFTSRIEQLLAEPEPAADVASR